jgi:hypothetical protein
MSSSLFSIRFISWSFKSKSSCTVPSTQPGFPLTAFGMLIPSRIRWRHGCIKGRSSSRFAYDESAGRDILFWSRRALGRQTLNALDAKLHLLARRGVGRVHGDPGRREATRGHGFFNPENHVVAGAPLVIAQVVVRLMSVTPPFCKNSITSDGHRT